MKTVVITGADGFIGRHLVRYFVQEGFEVFALTIPNSPLVDGIKNIENVSVFEVELRDWESYANRLPKHPKAFIHLAWAGVNVEERNSTIVQAENIPLALAAVRLASHLYAQRFILPGSTMEYSYYGKPIDAQAYPSPQNAYGAAKVAARYLCESLCEELHLPYIYAVISGIYAPDRRDGNVIYYAISELLKGNRPAFTRLEQKWDYVHIDDVVYAFYLIATKGKAGAFYSIGHGDNWPLSNYIYKIRDLINPALPIGIGEVPYRDDRMPSSCVDLTSLREDTGFRPLVSFERGIQEVITEVKRNL